MNSFFDRKFSTEEVILRSMVVLAMACFIVWRDLALPLVRWALQRPAKADRVDLEVDALIPMETQASELGIHLGAKATLDDYRNAIADAKEARLYGHPSLSAETRNRPNAKGFL